MENITLDSVDGYQLSLKVYKVDKPKGYVQIIHGMQEHQSRYQILAKHLNSIGYTVISSDIRGHGSNANELGYFAEKNGYKLVLEDQKVITNYIKNTFDTKKVIIFAHSMGTIITRNLLQTESKNYECVILSGYPNYQFAVNFGIIIGKVIRLFKGGKYYSKLLSDLSVGSFNKQIKNPRTNLDWLSYNIENVDKYILDPLCGFNFKTSAFIDLFTLLANMHKSNKFSNVNDIPMLLIAGEDDPCVGGVKGMKSSIRALRKVGFNHIKGITYENMRHEILNEKNYQEVLNDISIFLIKGGK